ncbi:MAG TPA: CstA-like transporter-associated (seleno)protein [Vicinamibacteria bacterium]|nr:CstA-like transporter-associated (seleno)protein [Vicinamibacteria bacterium]
MSLLALCRRALTRAWHFLREVSGDRAYEVYAERWGPSALSRCDFYLDSLERRYNRISRCC